MDPITTLKPETASLLERYPKTLGAADALRGAAQSIGSTSLAGLSGIGELAMGHSAEDASKAVASNQDAMDPELTPQGIEALRKWVPIISHAWETAKGAMPLVGAATNANGRLSQAYGEGNEHLAAAAGKISPELGGLVGAAGEVAPYAITPEGLLGKSADAAGSAAHELLSKYRVPQLTQDPSFAVSHEAADGADSFVARHPETGAELGRYTVAPGASGMQVIHADVDPAARGQGVGHSLLARAADHAHSNGADLIGDTSITPPHMANYMKLKENGYPVEFNPNHEEWDSPDGPALRSTDGQPMVKVPNPSHPDDATPDETPGWSTNFANGGEAGEAGALLGPIARLVEHYKAVPPLEGMPTSVKVGGQEITAGPSPTIRAVAHDYMAKNGIKSPPQTKFVPVDPARAQSIAQAFDAMPHQPDDPATKASYDALVKETMAQYQHAKAAGLQAEFIPKGAPDPYAASPRLAVDDIQKNNHMWVFPTESGFGGAKPSVNGKPIDFSQSPVSAASNEQLVTVPMDKLDSMWSRDHGYVAPGGAGGMPERYGAVTDAMTGNQPMQAPSVHVDQNGRVVFIDGRHRTAVMRDMGSPSMTVAMQPDAIENAKSHGLIVDTSDNPLLQQSGESFGDQPATQNDIFRVVHDYFGHAKEGNGFRANGEENAWRQHAGMYSDLARPAMTTETRGQNSWVNFGPHADANKAASGADTVYAPQKIGLLPDEFNTPEPTGQFPTGPAANTETSREKWYKRLQDSTGTPTKPLQIHDDTADTSDFDGYMGVNKDPQPPAPDNRPATERAASAWGTQQFAEGGGVEGGEVGALVDPVERLISRYANVAPNDHAAQLASTVAEKGTVTYNPTTGEMPHEGYAVPTELSRSQPMDTAPSASDIHGFMLQNQDAFDADPKAALHVESDGKNHFMHVAHIEPDFEGAQAAQAASGAKGIKELHTGRTFGGDLAAAQEGVTQDESPINHTPVAPSPLRDEYDSSFNARPSTQWTPGQQTVANPQRNAFPGIYNDPRQVIADASAKVGPEDPLLQRLFGVSRQDLSDTALSRQGSSLGILPGAKANPQGAKSALGVMTPANEQRLIDTLTEARKSPGLFQGMTGWYESQPLYDHFVRIFGADRAPEEYEKFNTLSGMASPGSDVGTEIARGTSARWLNTQGRFNDFVRFGGGVEDAGSGDRPADMMDLPGHVYHRTAQAIPMQDYLRTGELQMKSPKVPMYIGASGVPSTGFQTDTPVGDAHWARGVGLADTRNSRNLKGQPIIPGSSVSTPEMQTLAPWWRDRVAGQAGLESVPAQALLWGSYAPATGVKSAIGAPKMEILSTQIGKLANRLGISPEEARDRVIRGEAGAFSDGGSTLRARYNKA